MQILKESKIGEVVAGNFHSARIFESFGLDFCCGGKKSISDACGEKGINPENVIKELGTMYVQKEATVHFDDWELDFLIDYIVNNHHSYITNIVSTIEHHLDKVASKHGEANPELPRIDSAFKELAEELLAHMQKEEMMLFPYIKKLLFAQKNNLELPFPPFGTVQSPVVVMEQEHEHAGNLVKQIRLFSKDFTLPPTACTTYRITFEELKEFEADLHTHIHLENNILFPKAVELERELRARFNKID